jgi:hypothetical protein
MQPPAAPKGNEGREAIASLGGYVYQLYQTALASIELGQDSFLFLEVAEDYTEVAREALRGTQIKRTSGNITINSADVIASIDSFVELTISNPQLEVHLRHITTSQIGRERSASDRIGETPTLITWRNLARLGDVTPLRKILLSSELSDPAKNFISSLDDDEFREKFLRKIHFDCGAIEYKFLRRQLESKIIRALRERGGTASQAKECLNALLIFLLQKSIEPVRDDRAVNNADIEGILEDATHLRINRAQFEQQSDLALRALSAVIPQQTNVTSSFQLPRAASEIPLPPAIASRTGYVGRIIPNLERAGIAWIHGAAGMGKTLAAKLAAREIGGSWSIVNLRGFSNAQASSLLSQLAGHLTEVGDVRGILVDDLESALEASGVDELLWLLSVCQRQDILVVVTAPRPMQANVAFGAGLTPPPDTKVEEFSEEDIAQILDTLGVSDQNWARYIRLISGGGHPQLVVAAIQAMQRSDWNKEEFTTLNSLLVGNPEVEQVRAQTRARLLRELPESSRRLLERLSVALLSFKRSLVLDLSRMQPSIPDGGIWFDQLIGSWIDQLDEERFSLSPLLSRFAANTLTDEESRRVHFAIADSLVRHQPINPYEGNSALMSAWIGGNNEVLLRLCLSLLGSHNADLATISPHFTFLQMLRTDKPAYPQDENVSQIVRGAQLLILANSEARADQFLDALESFERECASTRDAGKPDLSLVVYAKLLLSSAPFGALPRFWQILQKFDQSFSAPDGSMPKELLEGFSERTEIPTTVGFMFLSQIRQVRRIADLEPVFSFLDTCGEGLRNRIFSIIGARDGLVDADMFVSGAWLAEHQAGTMNPKANTATFTRLEDFATMWSRRDLAVACRKYQAVIVDEYGNDKDRALAIIDEGLTLYGATNSELVRAKAKILYRAEDHQASLELSARLIESNAELSDVERAFLGREAAISAEKQGDLHTARRYYLYGAAAANRCGVSEMQPMHLGLRADAALASWHAGDRSTCLTDLVGALGELQDLDQGSSLRAAHCHSVTRHVLLWLDQAASGELRTISDGTQPVIYPGLVSNPEPHSEIGSRFLPLMEISWYMLAKIECHCLLDLGIAENIVGHLRNGPVFIGETLLAGAKLEKALRTSDVELFSTVLAEMVAFSAFIARDPTNREALGLENPTFGRIPPPSNEEIEQRVELAERYILEFASFCLLKNNLVGHTGLLHSLQKNTGYCIRQAFFEALFGEGGESDFNLSLARVLSRYRKEVEDNDLLGPAHIFDLSLKLFQLANFSTSKSIFFSATLSWLRRRWAFVWSQQRFLLRQPSFHETSIRDAFALEVPSPSKLIAVLLAILPTLGLSNESEFREHLIALAPLEVAP